MGNEVLLQSTKQHAGISWMFPASSFQINKKRYTGLSPRTTSGSGFARFGEGCASGDISKKQG
jgi:hypothetical protein